MKTVLGKFDTGKDFTVDMVRFMETRTLVMASSGGGKSWVLRKIIEELIGHCQVMVIDVEGEFLTLREKFDFVVAGKGGDVSADPRYADALCRRLLELNTDAICDLQELKQHERVRFVRLFLESLMNVPKELWKPVAVILDEAHLFAPEKGNAESLNAVIDLGSRGRKRGFFLIPATQRLSKMHKDVAAECQNKLIGLANLDIDRKRAAEELGFTDKTAVMTLRDMAPGEFYAVGPAFGRGVQRAKIGMVKTRHPQPGSGRMKIHAPAPTAKVKAVLSKLADLPKEAEEEAYTTKTLKMALDAMRKELALANNQIKELKANPVINVDTKAIENAFKKGHNTGAMGQMGQVKKALETFNKAVNVAWKELSKQATITPDMPSMPLVPSLIPSPQQARPPMPITPIRKVQTESTDGEFTAYELDILTVLNMKPGTPFSQAVIAAQSGRSKTSSAFPTAIRNLINKGLAVKVGTAISLVTGVDVSHLVTSGPMGIDQWIGKLKGTEQAFLKVLLDQPGFCSKENLCELARKSPTSSGVDTAIRKLVTLGLAVRQGKEISLNPEHRI